MISIEASAPGRVRCDPPVLDDPREQAWRDAAFRKANVDVFASTHTCMPATRRYRRRLVANNGAAGMPNGKGGRFGILTRISALPSPHPVLYGSKLGEVSVDSLAVDYDAASWEGQFLANWPNGSPAWVSYWDRIANGLEFRLQQSV